MKHWISVTATANRLERGTVMRKAFSMKALIEETLDKPRLRSDSRVSGNRNGLTDGIKGGQLEKDTH